MAVAPAVEAERKQRERPGVRRPPVRRANRSPRRKNVTRRSITHTSAYLSAAADPRPPRRNKNEPGDAMHAGLSPANANVEDRGMEPRRREHRRPLLLRQLCIGRNYNGGGSPAGDGGVSLSHLCRVGLNLMAPIPAPDDQSGCRGGRYSKILVVKPGTT